MLLGIARRADPALSDVSVNRYVLADGCICADLMLSRSKYASKGAFQVSPSRIDTPGGGQEQEVECQTIITSTLFLCSHSLSLHHDTRLGSHHIARLSPSKTRLTTGFCRRSNTHSSGSRCSHQHAVFGPGRFAAQNLIVCSLPVAKLLCTRDVDLVFLI